MISMSQILDYRNCPLAYKVRYVLNVEPPGPPSDALERGSRVHTAIANGSDLADPAEMAMVERARAFLKAAPSDGIFETSYQDPDNPGYLVGNLHGIPAVGIFDVHWIDPPLAVDWKTGRFNRRYVVEYEIQAYVLNELYRQTYGHALDTMRFVFLRDGRIFDAGCLSESRSREVVAAEIDAAIAGIAAGLFERKVGPLCPHCDWWPYCKSVVRRGSVRRS